MSFGLLQPFLGSPDYAVGMYDGYVQLHPGGAVVADTIKEVTVTKTGTGQYTFTLTKPGTALKAAFVTMVNSTAVDLVPQILSQTKSSVIVQLCTATTPTNPTVPCGINFLAICVGQNA